MRERTIMRDVLFRSSVGSVAEEVSMNGDQSPGLGRDFNSYNPQSLLRVLNERCRQQADMMPQAFRFIHTNDNNLYIDLFLNAKQVHANHYSHQTLWERSVKKNVMMAGYIALNGTKTGFIVNSYSGHFKPTPQHAKSWMDKVGGKVSDERPPIFTSTSADTVYMSIPKPWDTFDRGKLQPLLLQIRDPSPPPPSNYPNPTYMTPMPTKKRLMEGSLSDWDSNAKTPK